MDANIAAKNALLNVLEAAPGERIIIVCDKDHKDVGEAFSVGALEIGLWSRLVLLDSNKEIRKEIPSHLREIFISQNPDIFINLLRGSSEETPFRIKVIKMETRRRNRLGHCPGVNYDMLTEGALALTSEDYKTIQNFASKLMHKMQSAVGIHITNKLGTDLMMSIEKREFFTDTKIDWQSMKWMNLPVGEVIVAPVENSLEGTLVCDLAVGGVGKLKKPVTITTNKGKAMDVKSEDKTALAKIKKALATDAWSSVVGEFAFGLNPKARITDEFLEAEKVSGTCHIAFGNNADFPGGKNHAMNHMDFLISKPSIMVTYNDGTAAELMKHGRYKF
jgi:hypothetical protein